MPSGWVVDDNGALRRETIHHITGGKLRFAIDFAGWGVI